MFWGITVETGKRYTQTIERSFNVTMAALGFSNASPDPVSVMVEVDNAKFVLCTLQGGKIPQQQLLLKFTEGEHVSFFLEGDGEVHLTGYLPHQPKEYTYSSDEDFETQDDSSDEEIESELEDLLNDNPYEDSQSFLAALKKTKKEIAPPAFVFNTESSDDEDEENERLKKRDDTKLKKDGDQQKSTNSKKRLLPANTSKQTNKDEKKNTRKDSGINDEKASSVDGRKRKHKRTNENDSTADNTSSGEHEKNLKHENLSENEKAAIKKRKNKKGK